MNPGRVTNEITLVTGAGSGIGRATAALLAKEGASVVVTDIDLSAAQNVAHELASAGGKAEAIELYVADESAWKKTIDKVATDHQRLDILVNNAGISISKPISQWTPDDWRKVLSLNLDGVFLGSKARFLRATGE